MKKLFFLIGIVNILMGQQTNFKVLLDQAFYEDNITLAENQKENFKSTIIQEIQKAQKNKGDYTLFNINNNGLESVLELYSDDLWNEKLMHIISDITISTDASGNITYDTIFTNANHEDLYYAATFNYARNLNLNTESTSFSSITIYKKIVQVNPLDLSKTSFYYAPIFLLCLKSDENYFHKTYKLGKTFVMDHLKKNPASFSNSDVNFSFTLNLFDQAKVVMEMHKSIFNVSYLFKEGIPDKLKDMEGNILTKEEAFTIVEEFQTPDGQTIVDSYVTDEKYIVPVYSIDWGDSFENIQAQQAGFDLNLMVEKPRRYFID